MLCFGMRLFNSRFQFTFPAIAMQSQSQLYPLMLFCIINCSHAHAFHMSSNRVDYMWSHAHIFMHLFIITWDMLYSMLTCPRIHISYVFTCLYFCAFYMSTLRLILDIHMKRIPARTTKLSIDIILTLYKILSPLLSLCVFLHEKNAMMGKSAKRTCYAMLWNEVSCI